VISPIVLLPKLVNQRFPSGRVVIASGSLMPVPVKFVTFPFVLIRPIELFP
jgi:hypothetical protein